MATHPEQIGENRNEDTLTSFPIHSNMVKYCASNKNNIFGLYTNLQTEIWQIQFATFERAYQNSNDGPPENWVLLIIINLEQNISENVHSLIDHVVVVGKKSKSRVNFHVIMFEFYSIFVMNIPF